MANSVSGVKDCAQKCKAMNHANKYFGLECPRNGVVHCQCATSLAGSQKLDPSRCDHKIVSNSHCVGPFKQGNYLMGSHATGSVYVIENQGALMEKEFTSPPEMACKAKGSWRRTSDVANSVSGVKDCAQKCKAMNHANKYFGLECPRSHVTCWQSEIGSFTLRSQNRFE